MTLILIYKCETLVLIAGNSILSAELWSVTIYPLIFWDTKSSTTVPTPRSWFKVSYCWLRDVMFWGLTSKPRIIKLGCTNVRKHSDSHSQYIYRSLMLSSLPDICVFASKILDFFLLFTVTVS